MRIAAPVLMVVAALQMQAAWIEMRHGPFVVYTDAGAEPARVALNDLEQFRYAVGEAAGKPEPTLPWSVTVVVRKAGKGAPEPFIGFSRDGWILFWPAGSQPLAGRVPRFRAHHHRATTSRDPCRPASRPRWLRSIPRWR